MTMIPSTGRRKETPREEGPGKIKGAAQFGARKRGPRVDLHLCFQIGVVGHKFKAEQRVFCIIRSRDSFSFNPVLQIMSFHEKTVLLKVTSRSAGNFCKKKLYIYISFLIPAKEDQDYKEGGGDESLVLRRKTMQLPLSLSLLIQRKEL